MGGLVAPTVSETLYTTMYSEKFSVSGIEYKVTEMSGGQMLTDRKAISLSTKGK